MNKWDGILEGYKETVLILKLIKMLGKTCDSFDFWWGTIIKSFYVFEKS